MITVKATKNYKPVIWILAGAINSLVAIAFFLPEAEILKQYNFSFLPALNAILYSLTFISLLVALFYIGKKNIKLHKTFVFIALFWTSIFLLSYLLFHFSAPSAKFGGEGALRIIYYFILITHIFLAVLIVPLALISVGRGLNMEVVSHRKIARCTTPIWLYVSLTGVIVYIMISPNYKRFIHGAVLENRH